MPSPVYAVQIGRTPGIYVSWEDCRTQVEKYPGAKFLKFNDVYAAEAFVRASPKRDKSKQSMIATTSPGKVSPTKGKSRSPKPYERLESAVASPNTAVSANAAGSEDVFLDSNQWDVVYCDGACKGNGKPGSIAGIGVWWGHGDERNLAERCPGAQTNNRAELIAIIRILETAAIHKKPLMIKTDSKYSMQCIKDWLPNWQKRGFRTADGKPVMNLALIRYISSLISHRGLNGQKVDFVHVRGHSGETGNEAADQLANEGTRLPEAAERDWETLEEELGWGANDVKLVNKPKAIPMMKKEMKMKAKPPANIVEFKSPALPPTMQRELPRCISVSDLKLKDYEDIDMEEYMTAPTPTQGSLILTPPPALPPTAQSQNSFPVIKPRTAASQLKQQPPQQHAKYSTRSSVSSSLPPRSAAVSKQQGQAFLSPPPSQQRKQTSAKAQSNMPVSGRVDDADVDLNIYADCLDDCDFDDNGEFV